jgi:hypothetical protein
MTNFKKNYKSILIALIIFFSPKLAAPYKYNDGTGKLEIHGKDIDLFFGTKVLIERTKALKILCVLLDGNKVAVMYPEDMQINDEIICRDDIEYEMDSLHCAFHNLTSYFNDFSSILDNYDDSFSLINELAFTVGTRNFEILKVIRANKKAIAQKKEADRKKTKAEVVAQPD